MRPYRTILIVGFAIALGLSPQLGCKQTYLPPAIANPPNYLVVEGFLNTNAGESTIVSLSRTVRLDSSLNAPEQGAMVTLEGSDNSVITFNELSGGSYIADLTQLNYVPTYRLHIRTSGGKEYASDYVPLKNSPAIDSISWKRLESDPYKGVQIYANTHDPANQTQFYRYEYEETWEFRTPYFADIRYVPRGSFVNYAPNTINTCWHQDISTSILLATSAQLSSAVIHEAPLVLVPFNSQQISVRYSIFVKQYALTQDAFNWWQILQKNTEQIGSIFGVQPSANKGISIASATPPNWCLALSVVAPCSPNAFLSIMIRLPLVYNPDCEDRKCPIIRIPSNIIIASAICPGERTSSPGSSHGPRPLR